MRSYKSKAHATFAAIINLVVVVGSFEGLIAILNLNEAALFARTSFYVGLFFIFQIVFLYDLHFKAPGSLAKAQTRHKNVSHWFLKRCKVFASALWERFSHFHEAKFLGRWLNYLILPGIIFWSSMALFFVNFGFGKNQQVIVALSSLALMINYLYIKEIFARAKEVLDRDIIVMLSVVKIYASAVAYMACLALVKGYCLEPIYLILAILPLTFLLLYQSLFQYRLVNSKNLTIGFVLSLVMGILGYFVLVYWSYNYFTAGVFLTTCYNLMRGLFHHHVDKDLTWRTFWEIFIISLIIAALIFSATNFRAKILDACQYRLGNFKTST